MEEVLIYHVPRCLLMLALVVTFFCIKKIRGQSSATRRRYNITSAHCNSIVVMHIQFVAVRYDQSTGAFMFQLLLEIISLQPKELKKVEEKRKERRE